MIVRPIRHEDKEVAMKLGLECYVYSTRIGDFNDQYCWEFLDRVIQGFPFLGLVAEYEGKVVGLLIGAVQPLWFNNQQLMLQELVFWVDKEARGLGAGKALLSSLENICKANMVKKIVMTTSFNGEETQKFYVKHDYQPEAVYWFKEV